MNKIKLLYDNYILLILILIHLLVMLNCLSLIRIEKKLNKIETHIEQTHIIDGVNEMIDGDLNGNTNQ